jgi:DNA polymerase-4
VHADWEEKSISAEDTFEADIADHGKLRAELARLSDRTAARLRAKHLVASCVAVKIRRHDFTTFTRQRRIAPPSHESRTIANVADELLVAWLHEQPRARLRLLGVGVSELSPAELALFAEPGLDETVDRIRQKYGTESVSRAERLRKS